MDICWRGSDNVGEYMTPGSLLLSTSFERNDQKDNNGGLFYNNNDDGSVFTRFWLHLKWVKSWISKPFWILGFAQIHFYAIEYTILLCDVFDIVMKSNIVWSHWALKIYQKFFHQISHFTTKYHWCIILYDQILLMVLLPKDVRNGDMLWCPFCSITSIVSDKITQIMFFFAFYSILLPARFHDRCHDSWHEINCSENKWFHQISVQNEPGISSAYEIYTHTQWTGPQYVDMDMGTMQSILKSSFVWIFDALFSCFIPW